jgi:hypothetical protein
MPLTEEQIFTKYVDERMGATYMACSEEMYKAIKKTYDYQCFCVGIRARELGKAIEEHLLLPIFRFLRIIK